MRALLLSVVLGLACTQPTEGTTGAQGAKGDPGAPGPQGSTGAPGPAGTPTLVSVSAEEAGEHCPGGGQRIDVGPDENANGVLDEGEKQPALAARVCNGPRGVDGQAGPNGLTALVTTAPEAAGERCANGGTRLEAGLDVDGDGVLADPERNDALTRHVCNGASGASGAEGLRSLVDTAALAAGASCATGGVRITVGLDTNRNGLLDASEIDASLTRDVCNGAQGTQGAPGQTGPGGPSGPRGPDGVLGLYGDGSAGTLFVGMSETLDLSLPGAATVLPGGTNTSFTNIDVRGTLILPSGTFLRATGSVTVSGTIRVLPGASGTAGVAHPGVARSAAAEFSGGSGLEPFAAAQLTRSPVGGGSGARVGPLPSGGSGGGALTIAAAGSLLVSSTGLIQADGEAGSNPQTAGASILGTGGGGGGVVVLAARGSLSVTGAIRARGGNGAAGHNGNGGLGEGGGGGGGGGIVHLITGTAPSISGTLQVQGGVAGANAASMGSNSTVLTAGGGGGCGGTGGTGGSVLPGTTEVVAATAGASGYVLRSVVPEPAHLLLR